MFGRRHSERPLRLVSIAYHQASLAELAYFTDRNARQADLVLLPETCAGVDSPEPLQGPTFRAMSEIARRHQTYIVCPIDRKERGGRWNSTVLLDRAGQVAAVYDKRHIFSDELALTPPRQPGHRAIVHRADFGCIGFATCFDVNFPDHWHQLQNLGAELVVFPSAYSAGRALAAHAINHNYYVASATLLGEASVYDITGKLLAQRRSDSFLAARATLDLDRCVFHLDFNEPAAARLMRAHRHDVALDVHRDERWAVLSSRRTGVSARRLAAEYGIEELRHYRARLRTSAEPAARTA